MIAYKGIVCKSPEDENYLVIIDDFGYKFIPITDGIGNYSHLAYNQGTCCAVKFFDGTELVDYEFAIANSFQDIFLAIEDFGDITSPHENLYEMIRNDYDELLGLWEIIDEVFCEDEVQKRYVEFLDKDFYGRSSTQNSEN